MIDPTEAGRICAPLWPKPTVPQVLPIVQALYRRNPCGCCWHVVFDDGNFGSVGWVVNEYLPTADCPGPECRVLAIVLPMMSKTQLRKLARMKRC